MVRIVIIRGRSPCGLTWIWILQSLLETRECRAEGIGELDKDLVHGEDTLLPQVGLAGRHQSQNVIGQIPDEVKQGERGRENEIVKAIKLTDITKCKIFIANGYLKHLGKLHVYYAYVYWLV